MPIVLTIIDSCEGCGACCQVVTQPPFRRVFDQEGEDAWNRLKWERPDLLAELLAAEAERLAAGGASFGTPCLWYDRVSRRCRHYEYRPGACRAFEVGGTDCLDARRRARIV